MRERREEEGGSFLKKPHPYMKHGGLRFAAKEAAHGASHV